MKINKLEIAALAVIGLSFILGIYFYPQLPAKMASHWNWQGQVDGYMSKPWGVFFLPGFMTLMFVILAALPRFDRIKASLASFRQYYDGFLLVFVSFFTVIYLESLLWNLNLKVDVLLTLCLSLGLFWFYIGILLEKTQPNPIVGIRTPWTLRSARVWEKTHKLGGKLFRVAGIVTGLGALAPKLAIGFIILPLLIVTLYTVIYSYQEYRKEKVAGNGES
jgi:uncharacterized membrane protein